MVNSPAQCRWCLFEGDSISLRAVGAKARWIVDDPRQKTLTTLVECSSCGVLYFTEPFSSSELQTMYQNYRNDEYLRRRSKFEPWYTKKVNDSIGHSEVTLEHRRSHLLELLVAAIDGGHAVSPRNVLDVGGDEGQFIPELETIERKAVLEVSEVSRMSDVDLIRDWKEAEVFRPDLIMMCHVLEHIDTARDLIDAAVQCLKPSGLLYIEIPLDGPVRVPRFLRSSVNRSYTGVLTRYPRLFTIADLWGLVTRRLFRTPLPGSVVKQSEHINFFGYQSISTVLEKAGLEILSSSIYEPTQGVPLLNMRALGVLSKRI